MRSLKLAVAALWCASAPLAAQEAVTIKFGGSPGSTNRYQAVMDMFMRGGPMASMMSSDTTLPMTRMTMFTTKTLTGRAGDTLIFTDVVDSARMESPAMPQMANMMNSSAGVMRGMTTTTRMNEFGKIYSTEVSGGPTGMGGGAMGGGGGGGGRGRGGRGMPGMGGGQQREFYMFPSRSVRVGETWSDSITQQEGTNSTTYLGTLRLERVENRGGSRVAVVSMNGTMASSGEATSRMSISGEYRVDVSNGRLVQVTMQMTGTVNSPQMGEVPMRMSMQQQLIP